MTGPAARHCIKCGREVGPDESMCATCLRAGMVAPSASQYHGTVAVAIVLAVAALAIAASISLRGIGPWSAAIHDAEPNGIGAVSVTLMVTNEGSASGRAKCRIVARGDNGQLLRTRNFVTGSIEGGDSYETTQSVPGLPAVPASLDVSCE
jgi:hypothetical protein